MHSFSLVDFGNMQRNTQGHLALKAEGCECFAAEPAGSMSHMDRLGRSGLTASTKSPPHVALKGQK